tara:strand:+ start:44 stop:568 length:525 start_codon:yes stop_codon:yes gene_type:complete
MAKESKNLQKVQDMLDGNYGGKIQSGYSSIQEHRKVGDTWTDSEGYEWEQKDGYQVKKGGSMPAVGMFNHQCKDCGKNCSPKMAKPWDRDVFKADGRCYHCQMNYEMDLEFDSKIRWFAYRRLKDLRNMEAIEKDMEQWVEDITRQRKRNPFDETVANALANGEVSMQINKNKA